jgi:hypothetical protein
MQYQNFEVIEIKNRNGSLEHFYHFFYGGLVPLAYYLSTGRDKDLYFLRSCGPMNRLLLELDLENLVLVEKATMHRLVRSFGKTVLNGLDAPPYYNQNVFAAARDFLLQKLGSTQAKHEPTSDIVFINRSEADAYYASSLAETKTSANQRRSIPNFEQLVAAAHAAGIKADTFELESASLKQQLGLFRAARIVVAQHGAALANIFWMKPKTTVIEIVPPNSHICMQKLCAVMDVQYVSVVQSDIHAPVDVKEVVDAVLRHDHLEASSPNHHAHIRAA